MRENVINIPSRVRFVMRAAWVFRHWLLIWLVIFTVFNLLPYLAPVLIWAGLDPLAEMIYSLYGIIGHQMAHRSYFFFGYSVFYSIDELPVRLSGGFILDSTVLRSFIGDEQFGWKVAWSDRLVALFGSALITSFVYAFLRQRDNFSPMKIGWMLILCAPLVIDGTTHYISDFEGVTGGFRWDNAWLASLTANAFPESFYVGADWGSFNSITRLVTGILFGIGLWSWGLGRADTYFDRNATLLEARIDGWRERQSVTGSDK